jgi:hypothetical protein
MDAVDILQLGWISDIKEQAERDAQRIANLEFEVESLRRDLKTLERFQQEIIKAVAEKIGGTLPDMETVRHNFQNEQLTDDLSPLERLRVTGFRLPPPK